ncbi:ABC transporter ATP-binding protein [Alkalinema sp. FACHB-956]|uniref:ABC transporter ATP-binding protein n=1 Tax=Alkalinema sp. FACHB-956 TaxID=2692768 RepID=UPI001681E304|nr:ABC transporter ATP-binding protein [Alkalinema sp. FACHB-956]MBD2325340.1 ABC transporter ATP-binding protein [Alkalinema sp. FACHB-956]
MSNSVIQVDHLSKRYTLRHQNTERYQSLRDTLVRQTKQLGRRILAPGRSMAKPYQEDFWALRDLSFDIKQGDRVGIIGRNGAGKSTLLKLLSRITEPTSGRIRLRGRVASLLEVGTGFHPELTGRENIFLNGAILGMSKAEIQQKFDEIVAFAEVERFLDTPVKRYSSGMYVRLAFAVAAHLEPEILIVDEVLAVGDAQFQNKCLGKMQDVAHSGRTVLFVSHNMAAIRQLCDSAIMLQRGELIFSGSAEEGVKHYLNSAATTGNAIGMVSSYGIALTDAALEDGDAYPTRSPIFDRDHSLRLQLQAHSPLSDCAVVVQIHDDLGTLVSSLCTVEEGIAPFALKNEVSIRFDLGRMTLFPGSYRVSVFLYRSNDPITYLAAEDVLKFEVQPSIIQDAMWSYRSDHGITRLAQGCALLSHQPSLATRG